MEYKYRNGALIMTNNMAKLIKIDFQKLNHDLYVATSRAEDVKIHLHGSSYDEVRRLVEQSIELFFDAQYGERVRVKELDTGSIEKLAFFAEAA